MAARPRDALDSEPPHDLLVLVIPRNRPQPAEGVTQRASKLPDRLSIHLLGLRVRIVHKIDPTCQSSIDNVACEKGRNMTHTPLMTQLQNGVCIAL
jgi:hypothetical protein